MNKNFVNVDKDALRNCLAKKGISLSDASENFGYHKTYLRKAIESGSVRESIIKLLEITYEIDRNDFIQKEIPVEIPAVPLGYTVDLKVTPDKLCFTVNFNGEEVTHAWCKIKGDRELDLMQAISYSAHMCYKFAEQKNLQEGEGHGNKR